jgi:streptogramin lyase
VLAKNRRKMLKQTALISFLGLSLIACGGTPAPVNSNATNTANVANTTNASNATNAVANTPANANKPANATAAKPAQSGPKRISFTKGSTNAIEYFELEVGESKQFVIGAAKGQDITIGNGGDLKITMITKGKMVDETNDSTSYNGTTNAGGDFVFEVTNTAKKKNKSSVNVIIETIGND